MSTAFLSFISSIRYLFPIDPTDWDAAKEQSTMTNICLILISNKEL